MHNYKNILIPIVILFFIFSCSENKNEIPYVVDKKFIRAEGKKLVVGPSDREIYLRGINFNNYVWLDNFYNMIEGNHHHSDDFVRVTEMGMNVIRFQLSYRMFENDNKPLVYNSETFDWLDKNIADAKQNNVYLILDMHVLPDDISSFWDNEVYQERIRALWETIAERYKDETSIAAFDLINEPQCESEDQYKTYMQSLIDVIRAVDNQHLLIVERLYGIKGNSEDINPDDCQFLFDDNNVMYDFHFTFPERYTQQGLNPLFPVGIEYPSSIEIPTPDGLLTFDRDYLDYELKRWIEFGNLNNVPINVGEFSSGICTFADISSPEYEFDNIRFCNSRNGIGWTKDMIDIMKGYNLNFQFKDYHSPDYGIYYSYREGSYHDTYLFPSDKYVNDDLTGLFNESLP